MTRIGKRWTLVAMLASAVLGITSEARAAARAHAGTGRFWLREGDADDDAVWNKPVNWASAAHIYWSAGLTADGSWAPFAANESKFELPPGGPPRAKRWTTFDANFDPTPVGGTVAYVQGTGQSTVALDAYWAKWNVIAGGRKGAAPGSSFDSTVTGKDPWNMYPEDLEGFTESTHSLYIPFSVLGGSYDPAATDSDFGFDVTYETASGLVELLDIDVIDGTVSVTTDEDWEFASNVLFFSRPHDEYSPLEGGSPGEPTSLSSVAANLQADLEFDYVLDSTINLGIVLNGLPIPSETMADGALSRIGVSNYASEVVVPEPGTLAMFLMTGLVALRRR